MQCKQKLSTGEPIHTYTLTHMHMQPIDPHACTLVNNLISHREKKSNHTDIKLSVINKSSSYNIINKTFKKAHFTPSSYPILPLSLEKKKKSYRQFITKPVNAKFIHLQYKNTNPQNNYRDKVVLILSRSFLANSSLSLLANGTYVRIFFCREAITVENTASILQVPRGAQ